MAFGEEIKQGILKQNDIPSQEQANAQKLKAVQRMARGAIHRMLLGISEDSAIETQREFLLEQLEQKFTKFARNHGEVAIKALASLRTIPFANREELAAAVTNEFSAFVAHEFSLQELEEMAKQEYKEEGFEIANRIVAYESNGDKLLLHIPTVFLKTPLEFRRLFIDGLREIASLIQTDKSLAQIKTISGISWLVFNTPRMFENMGFTVTWTDATEELACVEIDREKFIELYGEN